MKQPRLFTKTPKLLCRICGRVEGRATCNICILKGDAMKNQEEFITIRDIQELAIKHRKPRAGDILVQISSNKKEFFLYRLLYPIGDGSYFCSYFGDRGGYHEAWVSIRVSTMGSIDKNIGDLPGFEEIVPPLNMHKEGNRMGF